MDNSIKNIVNIGYFIKYLTYYIKLITYINKGTDQDAVFEKCIELYKKYKAIELSKNISPEDETYVRKCLKRLNLVLKTDIRGNAIDIRNKENQINMLHLKPHSSIPTDDITQMINFSKKNKISILTGIPLMFALRESKYQEILWQYTRALYYISQMILSFVEEYDLNDPIDAEKSKIFDESMDYFESILGKISILEEQMNINKMMSLDKFLNSKLAHTSMDQKTVNDAGSEVKNILIQKGLSGDDALSKMIDSISSKISGGNLSEGNMLENIFSIANSVANEVRDDLISDPDKMKNTFGKLTSILKDTVNDSSQQGNEIPKEIKGIFDSVINMAQSGESNEASEEEIMKNLDAIIKLGGFNKEEFMKDIQNSNGEINVEKLEKYMKAVNSK